MAALTRSRGTRMRDIVATIQRHQDEAIRASARGITEITGGPGTGKTVVALHRAAYLLYSDRRRYESGGILVVGPSAAYTSYIERVLPSLGEETVTLRSLGDVVDAVSTERLDTPAAAAIKGSLRIRQVLSRAAHDAVPDGPEEFRAFVAGFAVRLPRQTLDQVRSRALRQHQRNLAHDTVVQLLADAAYRQSGHPEREEFVGRFEDHLEVATFLESWWPQLDPREVLLWLADEERLARYAKGILDDEERAQLLASMRLALETGVWSVADVALVDDVAARAGPGPGRPARGARLLRDRGARRPVLARRLRAGRPGAPRPGRTRIHPDPPRRARTVAAGADRPLRRTTRTCSSTRRRTSHRCSGGCSAAAAGMRPGPSSGTPRRAPGRTPPSPRSPARRRSARSRAGCSTWTRTTGTRARSSTTPPR